LRGCAPAPRRYVPLHSMIVLGSTGIVAFFVFSVTIKLSSQVPNDGERCYSSSLEYEGCGVSWALYHSAICCRAAPYRTCILLSRTTSKKSRRVEITGRSLHHQHLICYQPHHPSTHLEFRQVLTGHGLKLHFFESIIVPGTSTMSHVDYHVHIIYKIHTNRNTCMTCKKPRSTQ
jgi:hypothetical protein